MSQTRKIIWTKVDEAPALATYSLLPIVNVFTKAANVEVETRNISLAGRILANFPDYLTDEQKIADELSYLGELVKKSEANVIKLPNISASIPQLCEAIKELQDKGFKIPDYPVEPKNEEEKKIKEHYAKTLGSAANPVLRQGNSDRRVAPSVKAYAQKHPHKLGPWSSDSKTHVAYMNGGDFYENEKTIILDKDTNIRYEFVGNDETKIILKEKLSLLKDEVLDSTYMSVRELRKFIQEQIEDAKQKNVLFSVHLKATMMKISDPIIFGHFVFVYFKDVFEKYADTFEKLAVNPDLGLGDLYLKLKKLPDNERKEIEVAIEAVYDKNPDLAMVDSDKGITNLHAPNLIIIDASMPPMIRDSGKMWGADNKMHEVKAIIPDRCYSTLYQETIDFCKQNGAFDPATMGNVSNVGLMAQKAEEYGSHDKTFKAPGNGKICVVDNHSGEILMEHVVEEGDIYRGCQAKDLPIRDWVKLAVTRARATGVPAVFWLDKNRSHDAVMIKKAEKYLKDHDTNGLEIHFMAPEEAMKFTLPRAKAGKDTISVSGNAIRDYLTDLFPILELGTSAKMLSIVPLLAGGGLFETGAGGSAPKHVQQFLKEGHLRWDSLGEYLALMVSLEDLANKTNNPKTKILSKTLDKAIEKVLENGKSPSRVVNEPDNRAGHFYLAMYWAEALSTQKEDKELQAKFIPVAKQLAENEEKIMTELNAAQGKPQDIGGYYLPDDDKAEKAMRPSKTLNNIVDALVLNHAQVN